MQQPECCDTQPFCISAQIAAAILAAPMVCQNSIAVKSAKIQALATPEREAS
jgi:hypothetical protein